MQQKDEVKTAWLWLQRAAKYGKEEQLRKLRRIRQAERDAVRNSAFRRR